MRISPLLALLFATSVSAATATYEVRYTGGNLIHVRAALPPGDGRLLIAKAGGIDHLPDQWATFVRDLRVEGASATPAGKEGWTVDATRAIDVRYDVALDYAAGKWPSGNEQSGRLFPNALYTVTKPLFLYTSGTTDADVRFVVSPSWRVATPWRSVGERTYRAETIDTLTNNTIVIGEFPSTHVRVGGFDATVATPGMSEVPPLLAKSLAQIGVVATKVFDKTPPGTYLMTFLHEDDEDGESYASSGAVASPHPFDRTGMIVTGNTMVHELFHHWIGGAIGPVEHDSMAWFTEGFTEYYANVAIARSGAVPPDLLMRKFTNMVSGYLYFLNSSLFSGVPVADAGKRKGAHRFGVYNAGWTIALSLDVQLRSESNGKRSLDDVMRLLYERHGLAKQPLTVAAVQATVEEIGGHSYADFFQNYVLKRNELPVSDTLRKLGVEMRGQPYAADMYLVNVKDTDLRRKMFGF